MKKKVYVTVVLIFVLSSILSYTLFANDTYVGPVKESEEISWNEFLLFFDELSDTIFEDPQNPEDNIGLKFYEDESNRRGHRIRITPSEKDDKKLIKIEE